ncbi:MAG TPA: ABC transporter substrate-binding protein [Anaerolineales bacterium]|nr:ABC transporter substrate-binding protein [Anaerolineales bacterium]
MRKLFVLLSLLVLASMILSACGGAAPATEEQQPPAATDEAPEATEESPEATEAPAGEFSSSDPNTYFRPTFGEPETFDPALDYETAGGEIISNVYETLIFYNRQNADEFIPQLATEWTVSDDGTVYTFTIREGVTFHEGGELTPSDVAYTFQRGLLQGGYASPQWLLAEPFFGIGLDDISLLVDEGASADDREALSANDPEVLVSACEQVKAAIVADDAAGTVTMTLAQPWGPFLATIANNWGSIMDMEWVIENGGWDGSCDTWQNHYAMTSEENPFTPIANGTGPFMLDHWTQGQEIVLVRNDNYWRTEPMWEGGPSGPAALERVVIQKVDEFGTRFAMFQAGDADSLVVGSQADYAQVDPLVGEECLYNAETGDFDCTVLNDNPIRVYKNMPQVTHTDVFFNFNIASDQYIGSGQLDGNGIPTDFFQDIHIRKAFNYCFDWETYIADVMVGEGVQTMTIPVAGMPGYEADAPVYNYDPAKCEEEFKLADVDKDGIPAGDDPEGDVWTTGFRFAATYNQGNTQRQSVAEIMASNLAQVNELFLVETLGLPWPAFLQSQRDQTLPVFISGWLEDIHDPHNWYQPYIIGTYGRRQSLPEELTGQFQELLNQGVSETDSEARAEIYAQVNQLYYDEAPGILLATATTRRYEQRWVQGYYYNPIYSGLYFYAFSKQ